MASEAAGGAGASKSKTVVKSAGAVGSHSFLKEEQVAFTEHLNNCFARDEFLTARKYVPMNPESDDLFRSIADGILLCKLINLAQPDTVDERALNIPDEGKKLNTWEITENQNIVINSARSIGCQVVNIHASDLMRAVEDHKQHLVLGLIWQVVKVQLLSQISLKEVPQLFRLLKEGEELQTLLKLPPEELLVRWVNYHMAKAGSGRRVDNLSADLKDGEVYNVLLHSISPDKCSLEVLSNTDASVRAAAAIDSAKTLEVPIFIHPADITSGNRHLNLAFIAQIFNTHHGLDVKEEELKAVEEAFEAAGMSEEAEDDAREERAFRLWLNALNLGDGSHGQVRHLFDDLNDGVILIDAIAKLAPGSVDEKKVNRDMAKMNKFKKVENCNYVVSLAKELGFSLPGTGGKDIADGKPKLVLGLVWQLMRLQVVKLLQEVGGGSVPKDSDILEWANSTVAGAGKATHASSFKDPELSTGLFLLDLLGAVEPRIINPAIPTPGSTAEEKQKNAKYIISVARKLGAQVFLTWEDIVDVKPKMLMVLVSSIMHTSKALAAAKAGAGGAGAGAGAK